MVMTLCSLQLLRNNAEWRRWEEADRWRWHEGKRRAWAEQTWLDQHQRRFQRQRLRVYLERADAQERCAGTAIGKQCCPRVLFWEVQMPFAAGTVQEGQTWSDSTWHLLPTIWVGALCSGLQALLPCHRFTDPAQGQCSTCPAGFPTSLLLSGRLLQLLCSLVWTAVPATREALSGSPTPHTLLASESTPVPAGLRRTRRRLAGGAGASAPSRCPTSSQGARALEAGGGGQCSEYKLFSCLITACTLCILCQCQHSKVDPHSPGCEADGAEPHRPLVRRPS